MSNADERAHLIKEYRINAARMRERANAVRNPRQRAEFEQIARELDHWANYLLRQVQLSHRRNRQPDRVHHLIDKVLRFESPEHLR
jgi:hypothetical protein